MIMAQTEMYTQEEMLNMSIGKKGTQNRDAFDAQVEDYLIGLAIRKAREDNNLTQEELGQRIGVKKARICSIEKGTNLRLSTVRRIFKALGVAANLDLGEYGSLSLC